MENDEFVKCPLSDGPAQVRRADLSALLDGANLPEKLKKIWRYSRPSLQEIRQCADYGIAHGG
jgi:hypothetical protein